MFEIIHSITSYLIPVIIINCIIGAVYLLGFRILHFKQEGYDISDYFREHIYFRLSVILLVACSIFLFTLTAFKNKLYRNEITQKVEQIANHDFTLSINNVSMPKNDSLIKAIKNIKRSTGNRPNGSDTIYLKLTYKNIAIPLHLLRDSDKKTKYWVYYDRHKSPSNSDVGEINTSYFDRYK